MVSPPWRVRHLRGNFEPGDRREGATYRRDSIPGRLRRALQGAALASSGRDGLWARYLFWKTRWARKTVELQAASRGAVRDWRAVRGTAAGRRARARRQGPQIRGG